MNHYNVFRICKNATKSETKEALKNLAMQFRRNKHTVTSNAVNVKHSVNRSFSASSNSNNKCCCCGNSSRNTIFDDFKEQFWSTEPTSTRAEKYLCFGGGVAAGLGFLGGLEIMFS